MQKIKDFFAAIATAFRTRPWLKWATIAVVAVGGAVLYKTVDVPKAIPPQVCECPLKKETPKQGKKQEKVQPEKKEVKRG